MLLSVDSVVGLYSEAGKNSPQAHTHNENERILLELGPRPGHAVTDAQRRPSHRTWRIRRHPSTGAHTGLGTVARDGPRLGGVVRTGSGLRTVSLRRPGLRAIAGLLLRVGASPVAGLCPVARNAPGLGVVAWLRPIAGDTCSLRDTASLGTVVWVTWILWSSHPVRLPQLPGTTLKISRHQQG